MAAVCVLPTMLAAGWIGCATADEEVDAVPKKPRDGSVDDTGGGDEDSGGGTETSAPDTMPPPICGETGVPNSCSAAVDLGLLTPGDKKTVTNSVPIAGGDMWFKVTFTGLDDLTVHPHIKLTAKDTGIYLNVVKTCTGESFSCGDDPDAGGVSSSTSQQLRDFEVSYALTGVDGGPGPDPDSGAEDAFVPISSFFPSTVYFKVTRTATKATSCDFTVDLSN